LAFQGQGQLDIAFEKFRKCPLDDSIMDPLYNLALDYERKRQFNKAGSIYQYMADYNPNFRDLQKRISRSQQLEETIMLGSGGTRSNEGMGGTMMLEGATKPMLGRYQIEKELGKGAMGMVYLGRDPKINRVVAIKTMSFSQEFDEDELADVKERFFREAETAGRLNHPNIVTIYDAGDEHDLAYIAMEFLKGYDLARHTKKDNLLPLPMLCNLMVQAAEALDYAHSYNVVHRDIKPANIMYDPDADAIKITDFGIARVTDSSKTKTGTVLGTPSYMSPEQLSGKRVDGRSDLFSLGVMLYQLLTGVLPFTGDSMATLMFKIANESHPDVLETKPDLPPYFKPVLDRALNKDADQRYQTGAELAHDLRQCANQLSGGSA
jgi:serine/threonine protein kinase